MKLLITEKQYKSLFHETRDPLYTNTINRKDPTKRNKTFIGRDKKYGVGKHIGGEIYVHRNYANRLSQDMYEQGISILENNPQFRDFQFNLVVFPDKLENSKEPYVKFVNCTTFDSDREPLRGEGYKVNLTDGSIKRMSGDNTIYHHKWQWVDDDYDGFNVDDSYNWSKEWLGRLDEPANGNSINGWKTQLQKYSLK
jgi:hypothetical protein